MRYVILLLLVLCAGCGVQEHRDASSDKIAEKIAGTRRIDFIENQQPQAQPSIETETDPKTGKVTTKINPAPPAVHREYSEGVELDAKIKSESSESSADSYPLGIKLIFLALGLFLLGLIVWALRRQSAAVNEAYQLADESLAAQIRKRRERAAMATSHQEVAHYQTDIADLEAERGKLKGKKR